MCGGLSDTSGGSKRRCPASVRERTGVLLGCAWAACRWCPLTWAVLDSPASVIHSYVRIIFFNDEDAGDVGEPTVPPLICSIDFQAVGSPAWFTMEPISRR